MLESDRPKPRRPEQLQPGRDARTPDADDYVPYTKMVNGSFLVAAYRRPDFRVDVTLTGDPLIAGDPLNGVVTARYLFGAAMGGGRCTWTFTRNAGWSTRRRRSREKFPAERWLFVGWSDRGRRRPSRGEIRRDEDAADGGGRARAARSTTKRDAGVPVRLHARRGRRGRLAPAHRQPRQRHGASRRRGTSASASLPYFVEQKSGVKTEVVAVTPTARRRRACRSRSR